MNSEPLPTIDVISALPLNLDKCPTCDREIPLEKVEEFRGKIAAKALEQRLSITTQLQGRYAAEKALVEARAKAELEAERQQSVVREAVAREDARKAAEKNFGERQAEIERSQSEREAQWRQQLSEAEHARRSAEELERQRQEELEQVRANSASAIEAQKIEAKARETEIETNAKLAAAAELSRRIEAIEAAKRESEAKWEERISGLEATKTAAEQRETALLLQVAGLQDANEASIALVREESAAELARVRDVTAAEVEESFRETLTLQETALADAKAKEAKAEAKLAVLGDQHAATLEASLNEQRELLEKATEAAINAEKARAFEERQKLATKLSDLQREHEKKTAEELGEGAEIVLFEALKGEFPEDQIIPIPRGAPGADIRHAVMLRGQECGVILYDSKNHKQFRYEHVTKLRTDQLAAKADHAILVTHKFPEGTHQLHMHDGVLLANPARVVLLATLLRQHLLQLHTLRLSDIERETKTAALYDFVTSEHCALLLTRIDERADSLIDLQAKEIRWHENNWKKEGEAIRAIQKAKADLENSVHLILGAPAKDNSEAA